VPEGKEEEEEAVDTKPSSSNEEKWIEVEFSLLPFKELRICSVWPETQEKCTAVFV
jgi:hypothetical protein